MGKELTDAVAGILNRGAEPEVGSDDDDSQDEGHQAGDDGAPGGERASGADGGDDAVGEGGAGEDEGQAGDHGGETSLEDVARALDVPVKQLNEVKIRVADKDGEPQFVTLGQLKGGWVKVAKLEQERAEFDDHVSVTQLEQIDAHRRIMALIDAFPQGHLPPAVLQRVNQQHEANQREQAALLTKARPQWADPKYVATERDEMLKVGKRYGFTPAELGSIIDHRQVLLLQDFAHALARIDAAKGAARRVEVTGDKPLPHEAQRAGGVLRSAAGSAGGGATKKSQLARRIADLINKG